MWLILLPRCIPTYPVPLLKEDEWLNGYSKLAGLVIYTPAYMFVKVSVTATLGRADNRRQIFVSDQTPTLYISGACVLRGLGCANYSK